MFFHVGKSYGFAEVYGIRDNTGIPLDPHEIFPTRAIGYDNIRRNVLIGVLSNEDAPRFCRYLNWKFPSFKSFAVVYAQYPDLIESPDDVRRQLAYRCDY